MRAPPTFLHDEDARRLRGRDETAVLTRQTDLHSSVPPATARVRHPARTFNALNCALAP